VGKFNRGGRRTKEGVKVSLHALSVEQILRREY